MLVIFLLVLAMVFLLLAALSIPPARNIQWFPLGVFFFVLAYTLMVVGPHLGLLH